MSRNNTKIILIAILVLWLVPLRAFAAEVIQIRTGWHNGAPGSCGDLDDTFRYNPNVPGTCGDPFSSQPLTEADFTAARNGPQALVLDPYPGWVDSLTCDPQARWIHYAETSCEGTPARSVLYAASFTVTSQGNPTATIEICWAVDDKLGDPEGQGPNPVGVYLNGVPLDPGFSGGGIYSETSFVQSGVPVQTGTNYLYVYQRDTNCAASGLLLSATITVEPCPCDSVAWTPQAEDPGPRRGAAMAYDPIRDEVVLFGGRQGNVTLGDTWVWKDGVWTQKFPDCPPSPRAGASMVFDSQRGVVILHGGRQGRDHSEYVYPSDTWEWDGNTWVQTVSSGGPQAASFGFAYDPNENVAVAYGGVTPTGTSSSTWEYDGTLGSWTLITSNSAPGRRAYHGMVYDEGMGVIHMFGGGWGGWTKANWTYDASTNTWTHLGNYGPSARGGFAMARNPDCSSTYLYGGTDGQSPLQDLWVFNNGDWTLLQATNTAGPLQNHGMVYIGGGSFFVGQGYDGADVAATWTWECASQPSAADEPPASDLRLELGRSYPNPFSSGTTIRFSLPSPERIVLDIYDVRGRRVRSLSHGETLGAGEHRIVWDARDDEGLPVPSGTYFYRLVTSQGTERGRMAVLR
jgi:hypothetical protein